jgi:O-antigen/teichoic acid export membrane protein
VRGLAGRSLVYGSGRVLLGATSFLLLPLYTRYLTPGDYGVMAVAGIVISVLGIVYPLGLHAALARFYYRAGSDEERRRTNGTIWLAMVLTAAGMTLLLDRSGSLLFPHLFREVPFEPYLRLAVWTAFFGVFALVPLGLFQIEEHPLRYVLVTVATTLLGVTMVIALVVFGRQGAYGYLLGGLLAAALMAVPHLVVTLHAVQVGLLWPRLRAALAFSLPLVPHGLAGWVLELSDRAILERFVPLREVGLYALGYQFGSIVTLLATAVNQAWVPFLYRTVERDGDAAKPNLSRLATYYALGLSWAALGLGLLVKDVITLLTTPDFHPAHRVAVVVIGGQLLNGLYLVPVNFLFLRDRTRLIPVVTTVSGVVNVGLNLWLIPRHGILGAAWATVGAYAVMLLLVWATSLRVYSFPYEYRRLGYILAAAAALFAAGNAVVCPSALAGAAYRGGLLLGFPLLLALLGFFDVAERRHALALARQVVRGAVGRR